MRAEPVRPDRPPGRRLVELCAEHGVAFVPFFAIISGGTGAEPGGDAARAAAVAEVAARHDATPAQIRLAWTLHRGPNVLAIPGTGNPAHLVQNVAAGAIRLTADDLARLDTIG